jgi:uncharacterized protein
MEEQAIKTYSQKWKEPKTVLVFLGIILLAGIIIVSILRDRIVNQNQNQITVMGRGEVEYKPDVANINLGIQVDRVATSEAALSQMNEKMNQIVIGLKALGIPEEDIKTQQYNLFPQYDYKNGTSVVSGYSANQQLLVKVRNINEGNDLVGKAVSVASQAGANQVQGINFEVSDISGLKQQARILAIQDARKKSESLAQAAGIERLKKVVGWYENPIDSPSGLDQVAVGGYSAGPAPSKEALTAPSPNVPNGNQKIVIEVGLNYEVD